MEIDVKEIPATAEFELRLTPAEAKLLYHMTAGVSVANIEHGRSRSFSEVQSHFAHNLHMLLNSRYSQFRNG